MTAPHSRPPAPRRTPRAARQRFVDAAERHRLRGPPAGRRRRRHPPALVPGITSDAVVSRGVDAGIAGMRSLAGTGRLGASVVVRLGTNGAFTPDEMNQLVAVAAGRQVVLLTDHCPYCSWTPSNNA